MKFEERLAAYGQLVNCEINRLFKEENSLQKSVYDAMSYSIKAGGKRIRPILALATADMLGGSIDDALRFGIAVECIHTYSLIHDDLPCMDNDDLRRGILTCHKKFGEATALLAGDGLLTRAFELLSDFSAYKRASTDTVLKVVRLISEAAGCAGMIGGQIVDLENENKSKVSEETLTYMHNRKTGALIRASVLVGAMASGASAEETELLKCYADGIGLAFQVEDDILDCTGNEAVLGKPIGSDGENKKTTYVTLMGLDKAREKADELTDNAILSLKAFGERAEFLRCLADYLRSREC